MAPLQLCTLLGLTETLDSYLPELELCSIVLLSETEATLHGCNGGESVTATYSISGDDIVFTSTEAGGGQIAFTKTGDFSSLKICNKEHRNNKFAFSAWGFFQRTRRKKGA